MFLTGSAATDGNARTVWRVEFNWHFWHRHFSPVASYCGVQQHQDDSSHLHLHLHTHTHNHHHHHHHHHHADTPAGNSIIPLQQRRLSGSFRLHATQQCRRSFLKSAAQDPSVVAFIYTKQSSKRIFKKIESDKFSLETIHSILAWKSIVSGTFFCFHRQWMIVLQSPQNILRFQSCVLMTSTVTNNLI